MAKRAERLQQLAERRNMKIPVRIFKHVQSLSLQLEIAEDLRESKGKEQGKIVKTVSSMTTTVRMAGLGDPVACKTLIEVPENWDGPDELEKGLRGAFMDAIGSISKQYAEQIAQKKADTPPVVHRRRGRPQPAAQPAAKEEVTHAD